MVNRIRRTDVPTESNVTPLRSVKKKGSASQPVDIAGAAEGLDALTHGRSHREHTQDLYTIPEIREALIDLLCETFGDGPEEELEPLRRIVKSKGGSRRG